MRTAVLACLAIACSVASGKEHPVLETDTGAIETAGDAAAILKRAKICVAKLVRFDPVQIVDSASGNTFLGAIANPDILADNRTVIPGGDVVIEFSDDPPVVIARERLPVKQFIGSFVAQSTITLRVKDGRFRIERSPIESITVNTGMLANDGKPTPIYAETIQGKKTKQALAADDQAIAACISAKNDDW